MKTLLLIFAGAFACICPLTLRAGPDGAEGNLYFVNYGIADGLLSPIVSDIIQDKQGYTWVGTSNGLFRFDGYAFEQFRRDHSDPTTIAGNNIEALHLDRKGRIWIAIDYAELSCYDPATGFFTHYDLWNRDKSRKENRPMTLTSDHEGNIWVGMIFGGLKKLNPVTREVSHFYVTQEYSERHTGHSLFIPELAWDPVDSNKLWVGTYGGLFAFDTKSEEYSFLGPDGQSNIKSIYFTSDTDMWCGLHYRGLRHYNTATDTWTTMTEVDSVVLTPSQAIEDIERKSDTELWVSTPAGLGILNMETKAFDIIPPVPTRNGTLSDADVRCLYRDPTGVLWIGTRNGLNMLNRFNQLFKWYDLDDRNSAADKPIYVGEAILADKNKLMVPAAGGNGAYLYDLEKMEWKNYPFPKDLQRGVPGLRSFTRMEDGEMWAVGHGIFKVDTTRSEMQSIPYLPNEPINLKRNECWFWTTGQNGHHWTTVRWTGLLELDAEFKPVKIHRYDEQDPDGLHRHTLPRFLTEDSKGRIWLGTNMGLGYFDTDQRKWFNFTDTTAGKSLSVNYISGLAEDSKGRIWAGTNGYGLNCITLGDSGDYSIEHFFTGDGISDDQIFDIAADPNGDIWICTGSGITYHDVKQGVFRNYTSLDGLLENTVFHSLSVLDSSLLYVSSTGGFLVANFDSLKAPWPVSSPAINAFSIYNKDQPLPLDELEDNGIRLRHNENFFSFSFSSLDYNNSGETEYAYMLEGFDKDWNHTERRFANYTNVPGGKYTFLLKSANRQGQWSAETLQIPVRINRAIWETWWFYVLTGLLIGAAVYSLYRMRINRIQEVMAVRNRIARDLHDDMGSTLSSINMLSEIAHRTNDPGAISKLVSSIGESSQEMLNAMDDIVWSVNPINDDFGRLLVRMREFASEILEAKEIQYSFIVSPELEKLKLDMDQRRDFYLVYKEAINNLAKYSRCQRAEISLSRQGNKLHLMVADDGVGFDQGRASTGNGLRNMQNRIEDLSGTFKLETGLGDGTKIKMQIPVS